MKTPLLRSAAPLLTVVIAASTLALSAFAGPSPQFPTGRAASVVAPAKKAPAKSAAQTTPQGGTAAQPCNHGCSGCSKG